MSADLELRENARSADADLRQKAAVQLARHLSDDDLPLAFEMLGDRDWRVRKTIVEGLLRRVDAAIISGLIDALRDPENAGKRNSATEALVRIGDPSIAHIIETLAREEDLDVRLSLVNLLGDVRNDRGFQTLVDQLPRESDINILSAIVASIGKYRNATAIPILIRALQREDLWLKFHVIEALGEIGDRSALPAILPLYSEKSLRKPVLEAIGKIADVGTVNFLLKVVAEEDKLNLTALRALVQIADAEKPKVVDAAERHLIQRKFRESFPADKLDALIDHLRSTPKRDIRQFILKFLGWSGDQRALPVLLEHLENPETSDVAAQAIIDFGASGAPAVLERLRVSEEDDVTSLLLRVVNVISGPEAVPTILGCLDHDNAMIRRLAIETLGDIPEPRSIEYLLAKLDDYDFGCQQAAVNSISALVAAFPETKNDTLTKLKKLLVSPSVPAKLNSLSVYVNIQGEGFHDELLLASKDGDPVIRQKAISLMGKFSEERFADQLVLSLADEASTVRLSAIEAIVKLRPETGLDPLISSLEDSDIWIRTAAAQALGEYKTDDVIAPLVRHLRTDVTPVRIAAIEALGKSENEEARDVLFEAADDHDVEVQRAAILALGRIPGETVYERLLSCLGSTDWRLRAAAVLSLGKRGDARALPQIHDRLVSDPDNYVQHSAVLALEKMANRSSFEFLLRALDNRAILDDVAELFVRHRDIFRDQLEDAWRKADSRHERVIAAILQAMKGAS